MKLLLVRHGETDWNLERRYQSYNDVPLNQIGLQQAEQLAQHLADENIDVIYASDLSRAVKTAEPILNMRKHGLEVQKDARWREISFGKWEGLNHAELQAQWQAEVNAWYADPVHSAPPNGETLLQLSARVQSALDEMKSKHKDETVLLVAHGGTIQVLLCLILGVDLKRHWQFHVAQASLTILRFYEEGAILNLFNDIHYLKAS